MTRVLWNRRRIRRMAIVAPLALGAFVFAVNIPFYFLNRKSRS
jgi:hypothetical protein